MERFVVTICTLLALACGAPEPTEPAEESPAASEVAPAEPVAQEHQEERAMEPGLIRTQSTRSFDETVAALQEAITSRGLNLFATVPHSAAAAQNDLELRPTTLFIFGKPQVGTPLMRAAPTLAIDLPQKALVYEEGGEVWIVHNSPYFLGARHGLPSDHPALDRITGVLGAIAADAAGTSE
ncbi:MAG: DUF302 domain-containing protein [Myxococcota bacterium]